jgi:hypothetical protein
LLYCYPTIIGNSSVTDFAQDRGAGKQVRAISVRSPGCSEQGETLHLPYRKGLPIIGPVIAWLTGYFSRALACFAKAVNIARRDFKRFCK